LLSALLSQLLSSLGVLGGGQAANTDSSPILPMGRVTGGAQGVGQGRLSWISQSAFAAASVAFSAHINETKKHQCP